MYQVALNKVCVCIAKDNTLEAAISILVRMKKLAGPGPEVIQPFFMHAHLS